MFLNYIKIAFRNLRRQKGYSFLNITGLALGMACCILIMLYVQDDLSYDRFHEKSDRIFRVTREFLNQDGETNLHLARVAPMVGPLLKNDFPQIVEDEVRVTADYNTFLKVGEKSFVENGFLWADKDFFSLFSFPLIKGDPASVLAEPNEVVLTESSARKLFGDADPIGKTINYERDIDLKVTGVANDVPRNSHIKFDFIGSFPTLYKHTPEDKLMRNWGSNNYVTYLLLPRGFPADELTKKFPAFIDNHLTQAIIDQTGQPPRFKASSGTRLHLQKLTDIHLHSHLTTELEENGDITNVYLFSAIAFFVLLIACINFMNLATARSSRRSREIGMRKVVGAKRSELIRQFLGESIFTAFVSLTLAIALVEIALPYFNAFTSKELALHLFSDPLLILVLLVLTTVVGVLAGSYPAFFLSSFQPINVLKGQKVVSRKSAFRTVLVVSQFTISIALFICMGVVYQQMQFIRNKSLGYDKENLIILPIGREMSDRIELVKSELLANPNILSASGSNLVPTDNLLNSWGAQVMDKGQPVPLAFRLAVQEVEYDFFDTYKIQPIAGRMFSKQYATDDTAAYVLNESAVHQLGWTNDSAIGKQMNYGPRHGWVIGVVKDFNFESLHNKIVPIVFLINKPGLDQISVRISGNNVPATIDFLKNLWQRYRPDYPFKFSFLDERFRSLYADDQKLGQIFGLFSIMAVFIACLGLFGLASFVAEQRTKEIGVRKVLGARVSGIVVLFSKEFLLLIAFGNLIAWPVAYYAMTRWLNGFAYHEKVNLMILVFSGLLAMAIALLTVSYQSIKAAVSNPVDALKYE